MKASTAGDKSMQLYERVIITGGGGMLAQDLGRVLRARGVEAVLARHSDCDIADSGQVARYFKAHRPTLVLNCAADTAVDMCEDRPERANAINGQGVGNLAEACREHGTRLVHYSTDFVFSGQNDRPYRPDDIPDPLSAYGKSKLLGEENLRRVGPPGWITVRTAWLFGRHGNCFPKVVLERARAGHVLKVVDDQIGCPTYSLDLAVATFALLDRGANGIWHVTNSFPTSWFEFAKAILSEFAVSAEVTPISTSEWVAMRPKQAKRPKFSVLELDAYAALTGEKLRDWRAALHDYRTECEKG
jgi:dTDP-4-dehydrorhamnose reductase